MRPCTGTASTDRSKKQKTQLFLLYDASTGIYACSVNRVLLLLLQLVLGDFQKCSDETATTLYLSFPPTTPLAFQECGILTNWYPTDSFSATGPLADQ
jgi:hypothetical protein